MSLSSKQFFELLLGLILVSYNLIEWHKSHDLHTHHGDVSSLVLCPCEILVCRYSNHHCVVENCKNHQGVTVPYQDLVVVVEHLKIRYQLSILPLIRFWNRSNSVFCFSFYNAWNEGPKKKIWASKKLESLVQMS